MSMVQAPPPRFQISQRQWSLLAGIANTNVNTVVVITPHSTPLRNKRLIFLFPTIPLYQGSKVGFKPVGVMRRYERDANGKDWHDGLLMELLAGEDA